MLKANVESFDVVNKAFSLAGMKLEDFTLLPLRHPVVEQFFLGSTNFALGNEAPSPKCSQCSGGLNSIYAAKIAGKSQWYACVVQSIMPYKLMPYKSCILASAMKPEDANGNVCKLFIDSVEDAITRFKADGAKGICLAIRPMDLGAAIDYIWEHHDAVILANGLGFYETLVKAELEGKSNEK